jgi:O-antigen/teichoic acid export membrane protein
VNGEFISRGDEQAAQSHKKNENRHMTFNQNSLSAQKKDTIKLTGVMSFSGIVGKIISFPSAIVVAKFLGPPLLGVLSIIRLIHQYAGYSHLGLLQCLPRDVPMAYGRGDKKEARVIKDTVFTGLFVATAFSLFVLWILFISGVTFKGALDIQILVLLSLILIGNRANSYLRSYTKAEGQFMIIGKLEFILKFITPGLTILGVIFLKVKGVLLAMFLVDIISIVYYVICLKRPKLNFYINLKKTLSLLKTGIMIFINDISESLFWSVDLIILAAMLTTRDVGIYSIALGAMMIVGPFSQAVNMTVYRKIMYEAGKYGLDSHKHFRKYTEGLLALYVMFTSLILGLFILLYMMIIRTILTEYIESLPLIIILAFGYMVYTSRVFLSFYLNVTNQLEKRLIIIMTGLGLNALLDYILIAKGYGLKGVAFACSLSFLFISIMIIGVSFKQIYGDIKHALSFIFKICFISAILIGIIFVSENLNAFNYAHLGSTIPKLLLGIADFMVKGVIFSLSCIGIYLLFFKNYRLYEELKPIISYVVNSVLWKSKIKKSIA